VAKLNNNNNNNNNNDNNNNNNNRFIYRHIHGSWRFTVKCFKKKIHISDKKLLTNKIAKL